MGIITKKGHYRPHNRDDIDNCPEPYLLDAEAYQFLNDKEKEAWKYGWRGKYTRLDGKNTKATD